MKESKIALTDRLRREGRWDEGSKFKDETLRKFRAEGMNRGEAAEAAWEALEREFPPLPSVAAASDPRITKVEPETSVHGLSDIPAGWPQLPDNASLQSEISWCQANRLRVVEERISGGIVVHLDRARTPAPSWAALGWLETSIRAYSKYIDVVAKALKDEENEKEMVKRERMSIEKVRSLLAEMYEAGEQ